jgi:hypothetical protein
VHFSDNTLKSTVISPTALSVAWRCKREVKLSVPERLIKETMSSTVPWVGEVNSPVSETVTIDIRGRRTHVTE